MADDEITQVENSTPENEPESIEARMEIIPELESETVEVVAPVEELLPAINIQEFNIIPEFNAFPD